MVVVFVVTVALKFASGFVFNRARVATTPYIELDGGRQQTIQNTPVSRLCYVEIYVKYGNAIRRSVVLQYDVDARADSDR
jgi:hypothetical protein